MNRADEVFVGRATELAVGARLLQRAREGRPAALLLTGEPGIGTTSVLAQLRQDAERSGFRAIAVRADRIDAAVPRAALRLALEPLLGDEHDPSLVATAARLGEVLAGRAGTSTARHVHDLLREVVEGWAFRSPVLLTVDDLHDADEGTAACVLHLMEDVRSHRVQVIATTRPAPALGPAVATALDALRASGRLEVVALPALSTDEVSELVRRRTGLEPSARLVELLAERSGRSPFFLIELLDAMSRSGALTMVDGAVDAAGDGSVALPSRVTTAIVLRVFGLGRDARAVAAAVAVFGSLPPDPTALLVAVTAMAAPRVAAALDALVGAQLVSTDGGRTRFVHAIAREAVYDDIGPAARRRLHGRVVDALAALPAGHVDDVEIAGHVLRATSGHDAAATQRLAAAGRATIGSDPGAAADWYRAALAHMAPQESAVAAIQLALADALLLSGRHDDAARVALAVLATSGDAPTRNAAIATAARAMVNSGAGPRAVELLERAARTPDLRTPAVLLMLAQALAWTHRRGDALALAAEARRDGDRDEQALADVLGLYVAIADGDPATVAQLADGLTTREPDLTPGTRATARLARCVAGAFELDPADGLAIADGVDAAAPLADWFGAVAGWARYRQGRYAEIGRHAVDRGADGSDGRLAGGLWLAASLAAHVERDDPRAAEIAHAAAVAAPVPVFATTVDVARAMWHRRRGEHDAAGELLAACAAREEASGHVNLRALVLGHAVDAAVERDDGAAAREAADSLQTLAAPAGVATTMHVLLGRAVAYSDVAAARLALDHATRYGLRADAGRARGLVGALTGEPGELAAAYRELGSIGAVWRQRTVAHELRRRGHRVPHGPAASGDLSPVEVEVVSLVSAGLTNRQIAARMALSPKTVEVYLSRIYVKTGSRSRVELAVAARQSRAIAAARWASTST